MAHLWEYGSLVVRSKEGGEYVNMVYSCFPSKAILMVGLWYGWRSDLKQSPSDTALGSGSAPRVNMALKRTEVVNVGAASIALDHNGESGGTII